MFPYRRLSLHMLPLFSTPTLFTVLKSFFIPFFLIFTSRDVRSASSFLLIAAVPTVPPVLLCQRWRTWLRSGSDSAPIWLWSGPFQELLTAVLFWRKPGVPKKKRVARTRYRWHALWLRQRMNAVCTFYSTDTWWKIALLVHRFTITLQLVYQTK